MKYFVGVCVLCSLPVFSRGQASELARQISAGRAKMPPFAAEYVQQIRVAEPDRTTAPGWGLADSDELIVAAIDNKSTYQYWTSHKDPSGGPGDLGDSHYFSDGDRFFYATSKERQGNFGHRAPGLVNPAAAGYEFISKPLVTAIESKFLAQDGPDSFTMKNSENAVYRCTLKRFGPQVVLESIDGGDPSKDFRTAIRVEDWIEWKGFHYPKVVTVTFMKADAPYSTWTYRLTKLRPDKAVPLSWKWKNGAIVRDMDTFKIYVVRNGSLVLDPRFLRGSALETTLRRAIFVLCIVGIAIWAAFRARNKGQKTRQGITSAV